MEKKCIKILVEKREGRRSVGRQRLRWKDNVKIYKKNL
jgi:hypothetical protein